MPRESRSGTSICGLLLWIAVSTFQFCQPRSSQKRIWVRGYDISLSGETLCLCQLLAPKSCDRILSVDFIIIPNDWRSSPNASSSSNHQPPPPLCADITRVQPRDHRDQRSGRFRATVTNEPVTLNEHLIHGDWTSLVWMRFAELRHRRFVPRRRSCPTGTDTDDEHRICSISSASKSSKASSNSIFCEWSCTLRTRRKSWTARSRRVRFGSLETRARTIERETWQIVNERRRFCSLWPRESVRVWQTTVYGATGRANGEVLPRCFSEYSETSTRGQKVTEGYRQTANTTTTTKRFEFGWVFLNRCLSPRENFSLWARCWLFVKFDRKFLNED